jgi:hypothetical protein
MPTLPTASSVDEKPPRSDETVRRLVDPLATKLRRSLRVTTLVALVPVLVLCGVGAVSVVLSDSFTTIGAAFIASAMTGAFCLPVYLIWQSVARSNAAVEDLVRHAPRYPGHVPDRHVPSNALLVRWNEDGREAMSHLSVPYELRLYDGPITVFALPGQDVVAILLGESDLHLSMRTTRLTP